VEAPQKKEKWEDYEICCQLLDVLEIFLEPPFLYVCREEKQIVTPWKNFEFTQAGVPFYF
jgi:hypothetical protein